MWRCEEKNLSFFLVRWVSMCVSHVKLPLQMCCVLSPKRTGSVGNKSVLPSEPYMNTTHILVISRVETCTLGIISTLFDNKQTTLMSHSCHPAPLLWCFNSSRRWAETLPLMLLRKGKTALRGDIMSKAGGKSLKVDLTSFESNGFVWMLMWSVAFLTQPANKQGNMEQHAAALLCRGSVFWTWNLKLLWWRVFLPFPLSHLPSQITPPSPFMYQQLWLQLLRNIQL